MTSILIFLLVLFILVLVHELGHFVVAKWTGMRVDEFGIGFPPRILSVKRGETVYSLNLFPIGGFVKIYGEDAVGVSSGNDHGRSFIDRPKWAQTLVLVAGVFMNVLLAWIIFVVVLTNGVQSAVGENDASDAAVLTVTAVLEESPAADVGVRPGAEIVALSAGEDELQVLTPSAFQAFTSVRHGETLTLTYREGDEEMTVVLDPEAGVIDDAPARPAVGVALSLIEEVALPLSDALSEATRMTAGALREITIGIGTLIWNAVRFDADLSQVAGPVGIVGLVGEASAFGMTALLMFTAFISLNLAVINLFPFPALDGGRLLFVIIEALRGRPINPSFVAALNTIGFLLLIVLMIAITFNDIARIV